LSDLKELNQAAPRFINNNSSQSCNFKVKINDSEIKHTTCTKYLGVYIDQDLSWTEHIH